MKAFRRGGLRATKTSGCQSCTHERLGSPPTILLGEGWVPSLLYLLEKYRLVFLFSTCVRGLLSSEKKKQFREPMVYGRVKQTEFVVSLGYIISTYIN